MPERRLVGRSAAPGLARGVIRVLGVPRHSETPAGTPREEHAALQAAIATAMAELEALQSTLTGDAADMLAFQAAMLGDEELVRPALARIEAGASATAAWGAAMAAEIAGYASAEDENFAARSADLQDIRDRVLAHLAPPAESAPIAGNAVIAAQDLPLSRFLAIDWAAGGAIVLTEGSPAGHVAMLARARGVPMVVGVGGSLDALEGREVLVDAAAGEVVLDPGDASRRKFSVRSGAEAAEAAEHAAFRLIPARTADGTRIAVCLNIASVAELDGLEPSICDGIGLVRTELLFHGPGGLPDEATQVAAYRRIAEWAEGVPVVIRTLDAGGDKPIPGITVDGESNPFLGLRGLRLSLRRPRLFLTQLRALARAAAFGEVRVMLPMVTAPAEFEATRRLLDTALAALESEGAACRRPKLGIMVEVPAAAIAIEEFEADFFSIGSNDLTQYVTASGRDIAAVAELADPRSTAVLRLIAHVARHGRERGLDVSLCGDAAADPALVGPLLRAGLRSLSVAPAAVGAVKRAIAAVDLREATT